jgi:hypothetical protein
MKVSSLLKILEGKSPDEDICVLLWLKEDMGYPTDDYNLGETLTDEAWTEICKEFDEWDGAGDNVSEWIADAVVEKSEYNEQLINEQIEAVGETE